MYRPVILYRDIDLDPKEIQAMKDNFYCTTSRMDIKTDDLVIGRYSVLPFYKEQEDDILRSGGRLINTYDQHSYVADIGRWYKDLKRITPETWCIDEGTNSLPEDCSFVLKGETNSMKRLWNTHMFAPDKKAVANVFNRLADDSLIGHQNIYVRRYIPLKKLSEGLNGLPITNEFRFFVLNGKILCGAFYWSSHVGDLVQVPDVSSVDLNVLKEAIQRIGNQSVFYVIDVAVTENGETIVIELNDAQMAGLSENDPFVFYKALNDNLKNLH